MNTALLRGLRRPNVALCSSSPLCVRAVHRCQSSEPEQVPQEAHEFEPVDPLISDDTTHPGPLPREIAVSHSHLNGRASPRLPWATLGRLPPNPGLKEQHGGIRDVLSQHRGPTSSDTTSAPQSWDPSLVGAQHSPKLRLNGQVAPRSFRKEGAGEPIARTAAAAFPLPVTRDGPKGHVALENKQQRNSNANQNNGRSSVRLPWESMLDGISHKPEKSAIESSQVEKENAVTRPSGLNEVPSRKGAGGQLNGQLAENRPHQGSRKWDATSGRPEERRAVRSAAAQLPSKPAAKSTPLPWSALSTTNSRNRVDVQEQREMMEKMIGGGRYGGEHASHRGGQGAERNKRRVNAVAKEVKIPAVAISARDLAVAMSKKAEEVVEMLRHMGETGVSGKFMVEPDAAELVALEFGLRTKRLKPRESDVGRTVVTEASFETLAPRPPVVSVMGHVDHGKTTLLDALRTSKVAGTESAGITQRIGAFSVDVNDSAVTFFDTPGHAAFKSMRHSTSRLTDIVVVVVAADDGVKSQTVEVLRLLKEFPNLAPVVAVTKIDRYGVDTEKAVDKISRHLLEYDVITEGYGGQVPIVPVSAVTREGFDDLLETLMLQAEVLELRADDQAAGEGVVVDSSVVRGRGGVADVLVSWGKLKVGDVVVAGTEYGRVRTLLSSNGNKLQEAGAAEPVRIVGMKGLPNMGDTILVVESESKARGIVAQRMKQKELEQLEQQGKTLVNKRLSEQAVGRLKAEAQQAVRRREAALYNAREAVRTMKSRRDDSSKEAVVVAEESAAKAMQAADEAMRRAEMQDDEEKDTGPAKCFAVFKAEGFGMLDAMSQVMGEVPQEEVELSLLKKGVGPVTQSDVEAAALAKAPIFALNVGNVSPNIKAMAQKEGVQIYNHDVIYRFLDDIKAIMSEFLPVELKENVVGEGSTLEVFDTTGKNKERVMVAGLTVSSGKLSRAHFFRVLRDGEVVGEGMKVASMRRFKDRVNEVTKDKECGVALEDFGDVQKGDVVQCYTVEEVKRSL